MFKLEAIRDLNKVVLSYSSEEGKSGDIVFYTDSGWDFNFELNMQGSEVFGGAVNVINNPLVRSLIGENLGISTIIDIPRKYAFSGTKPIEKTLPLYLVLQNNVNDDIISPLNRLLRLILPVQGASAGDLLDKYMAGRAKEDVSFWKALTTADFWSMLNSVKKAIQSYAGKIYSLEVPEAFRSSNSHKISLLWGGHVFDDIFITGVRVHTDKFLYSNADGTKPIPHLVNIDLSFSTSRIVSLPRQGADFFDRL